MILEYEVLIGSDKFNIKSTKWWVNNWWVNCVSGAKMMGRDNVYRKTVLRDCGGYNFIF